MAEMRVRIPLPNLGSEAHTDGRVAFNHQAAGSNPVGPTWKLGQPGTAHESHKLASHDWTGSNPVLPIYAVTNIGVSYGLESREAREGV